MKENSKYNRFPNCPKHIPADVLIEGISSCEECHLFSGDHCTEDAAYYEDHTPHYTDEEIKRFKEELSKAEVDCRKTWPDCQMPCRYGYEDPLTCGIGDSYSDLPDPMNDGFDDGFGGCEEDHRAVVGAFMRPSYDVTIEEALESYNRQVQRMKEIEEESKLEEEEYKARRKELEAAIAEYRRIIEESGMIPEVCEAMEDAQKELKELIDRFELPF